MSEGAVVLPERLAMHVLESCCRLTNEVLGRDDRLPLLRFDLRGRSAGQALPNKWCIRLNPQLIQQHGAEFVEDTVPHEWAHLLAYAVHGHSIRPHGREWRQMMALLGRPARVYHDYAVKPARVVRRHAYHCRCQAHALSSIRHARVQGGARYQCRRCGDFLKPGDAPRSAC